MQAGNILRGRGRRFSLANAVAVGRNGLCVESLADSGVAFGDSCLRQPSVQLAQLGKGRGGGAGSGGLLGRLDLLKYGRVNGLETQSRLADRHRTAIRAPDRAILLAAHRPSLGALHCSQLCGGMLAAGRMSMRMLTWPSH